MSTEQFLQDVLDGVDLKVDDREAKLIRTKHRAIREALRSSLEGLNTDFLSGSYSRNTQLRPKPDEEYDVDIVFVFNSDDRDKLELLQAIHKKLVGALEAIQKDGDLGIQSVDPSQRRSVGVHFGGNFQIDIVPVISAVDDDGYLILDKKENLVMRTNPDLHRKLVEDANEASEVGGKRRLVPIIKFLKAWRRDHCSFIRSLHIELMTVGALNGQEVISFSQGISDAFRGVQDSLGSGPYPDPANSENFIDSNLTDHPRWRAKAIVQVREAAKISEAALRAETDGDSEKAVSLWAEVFKETWKRYPSTGRLMDPSFYRLGSITHAEQPPWPMNLQYDVKINAEYFRDDTSEGPLQDNGVLPADRRIRYRAVTSAPDPYEVKWQVINTGAHAQQVKGGLRGKEFFSGRPQHKGKQNGDQLINWESSQYHGSHLIECFVIKENVCVARSDRFRINVYSPKWILENPDLVS